MKAHLPIIKCRGRPKQSQTLGRFKSTQRKRKASVHVTGNLKKASRKATQSITDEQLHDETVDDPCTINDNICYICCQEDPPREVSREPMTEWTDCAKDCARWFHTSYIKHSGANVQEFHQYQ